jgi:hypothetical protein
MEHLAGKHNTKDLRLGDTVVNSRGEKVDAVVLNYGYAIPADLDQGLRVVKENPLMGDTKEIFLSKEEIYELYVHFRDKGLYVGLDS